MASLKSPQYMYTAHHHYFHFSAPGEDHPAANQPKASKSSPTHHAPARPLTKAAGGDLNAKPRPTDRRLGGFCNGSSSLVLSIRRPGDTPYVRFTSEGRSFPLLHVIIPRPRTPSSSLTDIAWIRTLLWPPSLLFTSMREITDGIPLRIYFPLSQ